MFDMIMPFVDSVESNEVIEKLYYPISDQR